MITIELDSGCERVSPGDRITGSVRADPDQNISCRGLTVKCEWRTSGSGNLAKGAAPPAVLFVGNWQSGQSYSYRFELIAPASPFSYRGVHLNIDWFVRADVDLPLARDPSVDIGFGLAPGRVESPIPQALVTQRAQLVSAETSNIGCLTFFGLAFLVFGIFSPPIGWFFAAAGAAMTFFGLRNRMAQRKLGHVHATPTSEIIHPGGSVAIGLAMTPRSAPHLRAVKVTLVGEERVVRGSGKNSKTSTHRIHDETTVFDSPGTLEPERPLSWELETPVPNMAAYTFLAPSNRIRWWAVVQLDVANWPDWVRKFPLLMWPQRPEALERPSRRLVDDQRRTLAKVVEQKPEPASLEQPPETQRPDPPPRPTIAPLKFPEQPSDASAREAEPSSPVSVAVRTPVFGLLDELLALPSYSSDHWDVIAKHSDTELELELNVDRCEYTFAFDVPDALEGGRTVHGTLAGSEQLVSVALPASWNERADGWDRGEKVHLSARPAKWNTLFSRLELQAG